MTFEVRSHAIVIAYIISTAAALAKQKAGESTLNALDGLAFGLFWPLVDRLSELSEAIDQVVSKETITVLDTISALAAERMVESHDKDGFHFNASLFFSFALVRDRLGDAMSSEEFELCGTELLEIFQQASAVDDPFFASFTLDAERFAKQVVNSHGGTMTAPAAVVTASIDRSMATLQAEGLLVH